MSAESGLDSMPRYDGFQPGASRRASKWRVVAEHATLDAPDSQSPRSAVRAGRGRRWRASGRHGRRGRDCPARHDPTRVPSPTTSVWKRKSRPEDPERGEGDGELLGRGRAGASGSAFLRDTTSPVSQVDGERGRVGAERCPARAAPPERRVEAREPRPWVVEAVPAGTAIATTSASDDETCGASHGELCT